MKWLTSPFVLTICVWGTTPLLHAAPPAPKTASAQPAKKQEAFKPFTGKVLANKVRMRIKPDVESPIIRQFNKSDLLLVTAEKGEFYAIQPPRDMKAYVFRSYVLDGVVEANRVNVRLEPHIDAPIIAQLQAGDKVQGQVCSMNHKWLEIAPPAKTAFYIAKEFISQAGGPDYLTLMETRKTGAEEALSQAFFVAEAESKKTYEEMSLLEPTEQLQGIVRNFADFPEIVKQAREGLALLKDSYLQKKIAFLESKAELSQAAKEELLAKHKLEQGPFLSEQEEPASVASWNKKTRSRQTPDQLRSWDTVEEALFLSWSTFHTTKTLDDFYAEQKANASVIFGVVEPYNHSVKNKPGDYILRGDETPVAYLYSTRVDLQNHVGKKVALLVASRPNNHFAFPAYYVLSVE